MKAKYSVATFLALTFYAVLGSAQTLEHVGSFWSFLDVQFLPGGYVEEDVDGQNQYYLYRHSKFEPFKGEIPALIKNWSSFDGHADYLDQVDASGSLGADLKALLPTRAKVKKFHEIMLPGNKSSLALICYTRTLRIEGANPTDIFVIAAVNANPYDTRSQYQKLWTKRLVSQSSYGDFQYQVVSGAGTFFLLYSEVTGGDAIEIQLDVYRMRARETAGRMRSKHIGM